MDSLVIKGVSVVCGAVLLCTSVHASPLLTVAHADSSQVNDTYVGLIKDEVVLFTTDGIVYELCDQDFINGIACARAVGVDQKATPTLENVTIPETVVDAEGVARKVIALGCDDIDETNSTGINHNTWDGVKSVTVSGAVTRIEAEAFKGCTALESIDLSACDSLTVIDEEAFNECSALDNVQLPQNLIGINARAFRGCTALATIKLPASIAWIQMGAFRKCTSLSNINLSESTNLVYVGDEAFSGCTSLTYINLSQCKKLKDLGSDTFYGNTQLERIVLSPTLTRVGDRAFAGCSALKGIDFRGCTTLSSLGNDLFANSPKLAHIILPTSTTLTSVSDDVLGSLSADQLDNITWYGWHAKRPMLLSKAQWSTTKFIPVVTPAVGVSQDEWFTAEQAGTVKKLEVGAGGVTLYMDGKEVQTVPATYSGTANVNLTLPTEPGKHALKAVRTVLYENPLETEVIFGVQYKGALEVTWPQALLDSWALAQNSSAEQSAGSEAAESEGGITAQVATQSSADAATQAAMQGSTDVTTQAATSGETSGDTVPVVARVYATNTADGLAPQANKVQVSLQVDGAEIDAATAQAGEVVTLQLPTNATSGHEVSVSFAGDKTISGAREAIGVAPAAAVVESTNEADASKQNTNANSGTTKKTASNANAEAVSKKSTSKSTFSQVGDGTLIRFALLGGLAVLSLGVLLYVVRRPSF